jgi:hypothetical protein
MGYLRSVLVLTATTLLLVAAGSSVSAANRADYRVGGYTSGICSADFNLDGRLDLAVVEFWNGRIMVFFGTTNGQFTSPVQYYPPRPFFPHAIVAADLNGDHIPDLAISNAGNVSIMINDGTGNFADVVSYPIGGTPVAPWESNWALSMCGVDLNGDGAIDLVAANEVSQDVSVVMNHGDGTFAPAVNYPVGDWSEYVSAADMNADGKPEIISLSQAGVTVFTNDGTGALTAAIQSGLGTRYVSSIYPFDFDEDGRLEVLACLNDFVGIVVYRPDFSTHTFAPIDSISPFFPGYLTFADFNRDGHIDIATTSGGDTSVLVFRNDGHGKFTRALRVSTCLYPAGICAADLDADGHPDLALAANASDSITVVTGIGIGCCFGMAGNVTGTGIVDSGDLSALVNYLTGGGFTPTCLDAANVNETGIVDSADLAALMSYLTGGGFKPPYCP